MSAKRAILAIFTLFPLSVLVFSHAFNNGLMLLMDSENFIPAETSIFSLSPYVINEGSSAYWIYAEDSSNYYHFTYEPGREYLLMIKGQPCPGFREDDYKTWCDVKARSIR
ncbi:hypothetical protein [Geopseudomonas aromaticivorans]